MDNSNNISETLKKIDDIELTVSHIIPSQISQDIVYLLSEIDEVKTEFTKNINKLESNRIECDQMLSEDIYRTKKLLNELENNIKNYQYDTNKKIDNITEKFDSNIKVLSNSIKFLYNTIEKNGIKFYGKKPDFFK